MNRDKELYLDLKKEELLDQLCDYLSDGEHASPQSKLKRSWGEALATIKAAMPEKYREILKEQDREQEEARGRGDRVDPTALQKHIHSMVLLSTQGAEFKLVLPAAVCEYLCKPVPSVIPGWISSRDCRNCVYPVPGFEDISRTYPRFKHHFQMCPVCGSKHML